MRLLQRSYRVNDSRMGRVRDGFEPMWSATSFLSHTCRLRVQIIALNLSVQLKRRCMAYHHLYVGDALYIKNIHVGGIEA